MSLMDQIGGLSFSDEVDEMLRQNVSTTDIAKMIQIDRGQLTHVTEGTLGKALAARRMELLMDCVESADPVAMEQVHTPRIPGEIARRAYNKAKISMDDMIEVESLYLSCRDRIGALMTWEQSNSRFYEDMHKEFVTAAKLIELHAKLRSELGNSGGFSMRLDIQGLQSQFGAKVAGVLMKPDSRHRVLSLIDDLQRAGDVIDADGSVDGE